MTAIACAAPFPAESFAACLRRRRLARHWTYDDLAHLTWISTRSLRRWENRPDYVPAIQYRAVLRVALNMEQPPTAPEDPR